MQTTAAKSDKVTLTLQAIGPVVFFCIPFIWVFGIFAAKNHPVPIEIQGCYKNGRQILQVQGTRIIVNGNLNPEIDIRYLVTNVGRQIETVNGSWLELDKSKPPYKQVGRNMIIRVQDNALIAFTREGENISFARVRVPAKCRSVGIRPSPA